MIDHIAVMKDRMTDNYDKTSNSVISKLLQLIGEDANRNERSYELMMALNDIDRATGGMLDVKGINVGLARGGRLDDEYRRLIKVKTIANLSNGDIPTMNKVLQAFMENSFIGIQEGWRYTGESATLIIRISSKAKEIPYDLIQDIKAAGVGISYMAGAEQTIIKIVFKNYHFEVPYKITNMFTTEKQDALGIKTRWKIVEKGYSFAIDYPITNVMTVQGELSTYNNVTGIGVTARASHYEKVYKRTGITKAGEGRI